MKKFLQPLRWALPALLLGSFGASAQAPANDDCSAAVVLTPAATCVPTSGTLAGATQSLAPIACAGSTSSSANDVWYQFTATATAHTISATSTYDCVLELFNGTCTTLTNRSCADAFVAGTEVITATGLTVGTTYYTRFYPFDGTVPAAPTFTICVSAAAGTPANDDPAGAVALTIGATCVPTNGTNAGATTTTPAGYPNPSPTAGCGIAANPKDVWYTVTTPASGAGSTAFSINVTGNTAGYLRLFSSTGGAAGPFTEITCASGGAANTVSAPLVASGLTPGTTYYVFVSGYGSANPQGPFTICAVTIPNDDLVAQAVYTLGTVSSYASPVAVRAVIRNAGASASTARNAVLTVSGATTFTNTQPVPVIAAGATATVTFLAYPVTATTGTNTVTVTLPADDVATNNVVTQGQALSLNRLSYTNPAQAMFSGGFGSNGTANTTIFVKYRTAVTPTTVTSVIPNFAGAGMGNYLVVIADATGANGAPGTILFTSPSRPLPAMGGADVVTIPGTPVSGDFFVGVRQLGTANFGLAFQDESPLRTGTFFITSNGTTFTDLGPANTFRAAVDVTLRNPLATRDEALAATVGLYPNPAHRAFTLNVPAGKLAGASARLLNALGQVVQTRQLNLPATGGTADFDVSNLAAGVYSLELKAAGAVVVKRVVVE